MADTNNEPKPGALAETKLGDMAALFMPGGLREYMSFDPSTAQGAEMYLKATLGGSEKLREHANEEISVVNIYSHEVEAVEEGGGEVGKYQRTVVFTEDGKSYECSSIGVAKSLYIIARIRKSPPPFNPPVKCRVSLRSLEGKKQWLTLVPVIESLLYNHTKPSAATKGKSDVPDSQQGRNGRDELREP